jgi:hypothetical protein
VGTTFDAILRFLTEEELPYEIVEGEHAFTLGISARHGGWMCSGYVTDDETQFVFRSHLPVDVEEDRREAVAYLLSMINHRLAAGAFAIDPRDGEVVFRTGAVSRDEPLPHSMISPVVGLNLVMTDHFLPAIAAVAFDEADPVAALDAVDLASLDTTPQPGGDEPSDQA